MPLVTFAEAKDSTLADVAGVCTNKTQFKDYLNKATRMLMKRGNWWGTVQPMKFCVYNNCWTWPRQVGTVLAQNICGNPSDLSNRWYSFMSLDESHRRDAVGFSQSNVCGGNLMTEFSGTSPVFNQIPCTNGRFIRVYISQPSDVGKTTTWFGIDSNGQTVRTKRADGTFQDGLVLTNGNPYVQSAIQFRKVTKVLKQKTNGPLHAYQWDGTNLFDLAHYDSSDTAPDYLTSKIIGCRGGQSCNGLTSITALVKLEYVPVENDDDTVLIEDLDALGDMIFSIREKNAGNIAEATAYELSAFRELNYKMRDKFPIEQFQVSFRPFGSANLERVSIGMV